jgi:phage recombination protein Bet
MAPRRQEPRPAQRSNDDVPLPPDPRDRSNQAAETVTGAQEARAATADKITTWTKKADEIALAAGAGSSLALRDDVPFFTSHQLATLQHLGVAGAPLGNLTLFFNQALRSQLDPFTGQIHMIKRMAYNPDTEQKEPRWTIQTGISGYYVIRDRAAYRNGDVVGYEDTIWYDDDANEHGVWVRKDRPPTAARVVLLRNGMRFPGLVLYSEVAGLRQNGQPMAEWRHQPAHMLEKCADAFACRRTYPADFSGIYTDEEMGGWDRGSPLDNELSAADIKPRVSRGPRRTVTATVVPQASSEPSSNAPVTATPKPPADAGARADDDAEPATGVVVDPPPGTKEPGKSERPKNDRQRRMSRMHALLGELGLGGDELRPARLGLLAMLARASDSQQPLDLSSSAELSDAQIELCIGKLEQVQRAARDHDEPLADVQAALFRLAEAGGWDRSDDPESDRDE